MYKVAVSCLLRSVYLVVLEAKETENVWQKLFVDKKDRFWNLLVWVWFYLNIHRCVTKWLTLPVCWSLPWQVKGNAEGTRGHGDKWQQRKFQLQQGWTVLWEQLSTGTGCPGPFGGSLIRDTPNLTGQGLDWPGLTLKLALFGAGGCSRDLWQSVASWITLCFIAFTWHGCITW